MWLSCYLILSYTRYGPGLVEPRKGPLHKPVTNPVFYHKTQLSLVTAPGMPTSWEKAPLPKFTEASTMANRAQ